MTIFHASHQKNNYNFIVMRISISTDSTVVHFITSLYLCSQKEESQLNRLLCYVIPCFPLEYTMSHVSQSNERNRPNPYRSAQCFDNHFSEVTIDYKSNKVGFIEHPFPLFGLVIKSLCHEIDVG